LYCGSYERAWLILSASLVSILCSNYILVILWHNLVVLFALDDWMLSFSLIFDSRKSCLTLHCTTAFWYGVDMSSWSGKSNSAFDMAFQFTAIWNGPRSPARSPWWTNHIRGSDFIIHCLIFVSWSDNSIWMMTIPSRIYDNTRIFTSAKMGLAHIWCTCLQYSVLMCEYWRNWWLDTIFVMTRHGVMIGFYDLREILLVPLLATAMVFHKSKTTLYGVQICSDGILGACVMLVAILNCLIPFLQIGLVSVATKGDDMDSRAVCSSASGDCFIDIDLVSTFSLTVNPSQLLSRLHVPNPV